MQKLESSIAADSKNFLGEILLYPAALSKYGNFELSDFAAGLPERVESCFSLGFNEQLWSNH